VVKILSQSGISLADVYDIEGSIAGVEQLESREVSLIHEMGGTIFSERYSTTFRRLTSGAIGQNQTDNFVLTDLPVTPFKILGLVVTVSTSGRTNRINISIRDGGAGREMPIWAWDSANDGDMNVQLDDNGGGVALTIIHVPVIYPNVFPLVVAGTDQPQHTSELAMRQVTTAFGAGTVTHTMVMLLALPNETTQISSYGLPIPGW